MKYIGTQHIQDTIGFDKICILNIDIQCSNFVKHKWYRQSTIDVLQKYRLDKLDDVSDVILMLQVLEIVTAPVIDESMR